MLDHVSHRVENDDHELLYFWALGDLHFRAEAQWNALHTQRMQPLFQDLQRVWREEEAPMFCVSPGDLVERGSAENYALAKAQLAKHLRDMPFYPGIGNHEFYPENGEMAIHPPEDFTKVWNKPPRYFWLLNGVLCIMLDQPDPWVPEPMKINPVYFSEESLSFLRTTLSQHPHHTAIVFAHCPLHNTVLDRDPVRNLDDDSQDTFFYVENSHEVRAILAEHAHGALYICGHTHSGWGSPNLIFTETLGNHPVTHINLMSPWYTGTRGGPRLDPATNQWEYRPDAPDIQSSFAIRVYRDRAVIRMRHHPTQAWMAEWTVPLQPASSISNNK